MSCSHPSELKDFIRKLQTKDRGNSDVKTKKYLRENHHNTDTLDRDNIVYGVNINTHLMSPLDKRHKRNTVKEREQENPILERFFGMNQMIRLMSVDYPVMFIFMIILIFHTSGAE